MAHKQKEPRVKKSVRFDIDTLELIKKQAKRSGEAFSEVIRRAVTRGLPGRKRVKNK